MSKYSGCRGQRFALREHTYTSRVIHTLVCVCVCVCKCNRRFATEARCTCTRRLRAHETASGSSVAGGEGREGRGGTKGGNAVQPLTEFDGFEKSWESAVACSRIASEHQTRTERVAEERVGARMRDEVYETITE